MVNVKNLFEVELPAVLAANPDKVKSVNARFQINLTGEGGGSWNVNATPGGTVTVGTAAADCTLTTSVDNFQKIYAEPSVAMGMVFGGKLKIEGNMMLASKLGNLFK